jgi:hypothetical protein
VALLNPKSQKRQNSASLKLPLLILRLLVYSNSMQMTMAFVSLYGLIEGIAKVPRKRLSSIKSLLRYGASVLQHGIGYTI